MKLSTKTSAIILTLCFSSMSLEAIKLTNEAKKGQILYTKANCQKCHDLDGEFDPKESKATNHQELTTWVKNCATHFETGWFPEEEQKVIKYLNETHYQLKSN